MSKGINEATADVVLARVEQALQKMFGEDVVLNITADSEVDTYLVKASATSDAILAKGYRELAEMARNA